MVRVGPCHLVAGNSRLVRFCRLAQRTKCPASRRWQAWFARGHLRQLFPCLPAQSGYNKRLRRLAGTIRWLTGALARDTTMWSDDVWVADSTPVECGRSRETARRSDLAGWAEYGYCASHSRYFWGLRLHLLTTVHGLPIGFALTGAKADERQVLLSLLATDPQLAAMLPGQTLIADKNYYGRDFEAALAAEGACLLRPARQGEPTRPGTQFFRPLRQLIESVNDTLKGATRPGAPRRAHPSWRDRPRPAAHPRPDRGHLPQQPHRPAGHVLPDRLRPRLTPWNRSSSRNLHPHHRRGPGGLPGRGRAVRVRRRRRGAHAAG